MVFGIVISCGQFKSSNFIRSQLKEKLLYIGKQDKIEEAEDNLGENVKTINING